MKNFEIAKILIEKGANVNAQNLRKETPLFEGIIFILRSFLVNSFY